MTTTEDEAILMYTTTDMPVNAICAEHSKQPQWLYYILRKYNIPLRTQIPPEVQPEVEVSGMRVAVKVQELSTDVQMRIINMFEQDGLTGVEIARKLQVKYSRVLKVLHNARISIVPGRRAGRTWTKGRKEILEDFNNPNLAIEDILIKHGISLGTLYKVVRKEASELSRLIKANRWGRNEAIVEEVLRRIREELVSDEVAKREALAVELGEVGEGQSAGPNGEVQLRLF